MPPTYFCEKTGVPLTKPGVSDAIDPVNGVPEVDGKKDALEVAKAAKEQLQAQAANVRIGSTEQSATKATVDHRIIERQIEVPVVEGGPTQTIEEKVGPSKTRAIGGDGLPMKAVPADGLTEQDVKDGIQRITGGSDDTGAVAEALGDTKAEGDPAPEDVVKAHEQRQGEADAVKLQSERDAIKKNLTGHAADVKSKSQAPSKK